MIRTGHHTTLYLVDPHRVDILIRVILTVLASILLLIPVLILFKLQPRKRSEIGDKGTSQFTTILVFKLLFSFSCSVFTKARRQEVFSATSAYVAVLVIFLGTTSGSYGQLPE